MAKATQKRRGRPPGTDLKQQLSSLGGSVFSGAGRMTLHIFNVAVGEGRRGIVILSGIGSISAAISKFQVLVKVSHTRDTLTWYVYQALTSMMSMALMARLVVLMLRLLVLMARLIGGPVEGLLIAGSTVQVIAGTMVPFTSKPKNKSAEDLDPSRDTHHSILGNSVSTAKISQNLNPMGAWTSSR